LMPVHARRKFRSLPGQAGSLPGPAGSKLLLCRKELPLVFAKSVSYDDSDASWEWPAMMTLKRSLALAPIHYVPNLPE
jgi:hypothetical protein